MQQTIKNIYMQKNGSSASARSTRPGQCRCQIAKPTVVICQHQPHMHKRAGCAPNHRRLPLADRPHAWRAVKIPNIFPTSSGQTAVALYQSCCGENHMTARLAFLRQSVRYIHTPLLENRTSRYGPGTEKERLVHVSHKSMSGSTSRLGLLCLGSSALVKNSTGTRIWVSRRLFAS